MRTIALASDGTQLWDVSGAQSLETLSAVLIPRELEPIAELKIVVEAADIRAEMNRRLRLLLGAQDNEHLVELIARGHREATVLLNLRVSGATLSDAQEARAAQLEGLETMIGIIEQRAADLAEKNPIPSDYDSEGWWV